MNINEFNFKKKYGQNFINDKNLINKIVDSANIDNNTLVMEIGPGNGALTTELIKKCKQMVIYEIDMELKDILQKKLQDYKNYDIYFKDFLQTNINDDLNKYKYEHLVIVSNLPYYITTQIIKKIMYSNVIVDEMVLMVQKEVADRLCAVPQTKEYGYITVLLNYFFDIKKLFIVKRDMFVPKPNVDSCVIKLSRKSITNKVKDINKFIVLLQDSFKYKRKNLKNNLKGYNFEIIEAVLKDYNLSLINRAEELPLDVFIDLSNKL